jgi:hypothetical protein
MDPYVAYAPLDDERMDPYVAYAPLDDERMDPYVAIAPLDDAPYPKLALSLLRMFRLIKNTPNK